MGFLSFVSKGFRVEKKTVTVDRPVEQEQAWQPAPTLAPPQDIGVPHEFTYVAQEQRSQIMPHDMRAPAFAQPQQPQYEQYAQPAQSILFDRDMPSLATGQYDQSLAGQSLGNRNILVIVPKTNQDVTHIVQNLQNGEACVINMDCIPMADAQRRLDFLSGVICAIGGTIRSLDQHKYILTPQGLGVRG